MNFKLIVFLTLIHHINSCSEYLKYYRDYDGTIYGLLTIRPGLIERINIEVQLSVAARLYGTPGKITLINTEVYDDLSNNRELGYKVYPSITEPLPTPISIILNGRQLCFGVPARGDYVTTIKLLHTYMLYGPNIPRNSYEPNIFEQQSPQFISEPTYRSYYQPETTTNRPYYHPETTKYRPYEPPQTTTTTTTQRSVINTPENNQNKVIQNNFITQTQANDQCGIRNIDSQRFSSLIVGGQNANPNEFPWLAAFFHKNSYQCSGSLVSKNIVVFAAHCVENKGETTQKKTFDSRFDLGKHDIDDPNEVNSISSGVENFILHPNWNSLEKRYNGDIAVAILNTEIKFTAYISPICMWQQTTNHDDLTKKKGVIAGWGKTENGETSRFPRHVLLPAVSDDVCLRSNKGFSEITSSSTFCVGDMRGSVPCIGDSGAGFAVKSGNNYFLRGIVSSAIVDQEVETCSTTNYVVFTDAALYSNWINRFIRAYA